MEYRSKIEIDGQVRIITVEGYDVCACCAPHVARTGEIGLLKVVDHIKYKGGTRVSILCGFRALTDYREKLGLPVRFQELCRFRRGDRAGGGGQVRGKRPPAPEKRGTDRASDRAGGGSDSLWSGECLVLLRRPGGRGHAPGSQPGAGAGGKVCRRVLRG